MHRLTTFAVAGLFAAAVSTSAIACSGHKSHTADISKPATTAEAPISTPKPKTGS